MSFVQNSLETEAVKVVGIDWATKGSNRALVELVFVEAKIVVARVESPLGDFNLLEIMNSSDFNAVAVDIPFGWPTEFVRFVKRWTPCLGTARVPDTSHFRFRTTDLVVRQETDQQPFSISADKFAMGTRLWADIVCQNRLSGRIDTGNAEKVLCHPILEVYPAATLRVLSQKYPDIPIDGYTWTKEETKNEALEKRGVLMDQLAEQFEIHFMKGTRAQTVGSRKDHHEMDALLAALTSLMYCDLISGWTVRRPQSAEEKEAASKEGWIFFPVPNDS